MLTQHLSAGTVLQGSVYRYTIKKVLGQGAFGITYLATTEVEGPLGRLPMNVALKEFFAKDLNGRGEDGSVREVSSDSIASRYGRAFQRESLNLSHMRHPGIIRVLESFEANNTYYYAMEYVDGGSLDSYILSKGRLSEKEAVDCIGAIGSALSYMHEQKMLHLDLKPKNIMLRTDGSPVLIDFGLSKQYDSSGEPESSSTIGLGTPGYAPIEQANSSSGRDFAATLDIYALGGTFYKMLTGKSPVDASIILNDGFPEDELRNSGVSNKSIEAIRRAMSPQRKSRPQSVQEFLSLLDGGRPASSSVPAADEETKVNTGLKRDSSSVSVSSSPKRSSHIGLWIALCLFVCVGVVSFLLLMPGKTSAPTPPAVPTGTLKISSVPSGAVLWLDGKNMEKSTPLTVENLSAGVHQVVLKLDGYEDGVKEVAVSSSAHMECSVTLKKKVSSVEPPVVQRGTLKVSSTPSGASIWLDGKNTGKTTPEVLEDLSVGKHTIVLKLSGYQESSKSVSVVSSQRGDCRVDLVKEPEVVRTGTLKVSSTPSGASIWLDGKNTGKTTPEILEDMAIGSHKIVLKHEGYQDGAKQVSVSSGKRTECTVALTKIPEPAKPSTPQNYTETALGVNMKMVYVAGGSFTMGAEQGSDSDEKPAHQVTLSGYYIGAYEVTQGQWEQVMGTSVTQQRDKVGSGWPLYGVGSDYPMYYVSWDEAQTFCRELSRLTGKRYVLPTEAQWEYAARGGNRNEGTEYSGSDAVDVVAWYSSNSGSSIHPVGTKRPNALGLYDMSGNVYEWCADWYGSYPTTSQTNPTGPVSGSSRVLRGGSWYYWARSCRVSDRHERFPSKRSGSDGGGFRVVCLP